MANEQNLIPVTKRTPREQKEISSKGGKASAKAKQERKTLKQELLLLLEEEDTQKKISLSLLEQAKQGNVKAYETIRDTIGEKPKEQLEISKPINETVDEIESYMNKKNE